MGTRLRAGGLPRRVHTCVRLSRLALRAGGSLRLRITAGATVAAHNELDTTIAISCAGAAAAAAAGTSTGISHLRSARFEYAMPLWDRQCVCTSLPQQMVARTMPAPVRPLRQRLTAAAAVAA